MHQLPRLHCVRIVRWSQLPLTIRNSRFKQLDSELTKAYPDTADKIFDQHWQTWFTEADVQRLKELGINTVRIPVRPIFPEAFRFSVLTICVEARLLARRTPRRRGRILSQRWNAPPRKSPYPPLVSLTPYTASGRRLGVVEGRRHRRYSRPPRPPRCPNRKPDVRRKVSQYPGSQEPRGLKQPHRCTSDLQFYASDFIRFSPIA
jgi:hypothetical protein